MAESDSIPVSKRCKRCKVEKSISEFWALRASKDGRAWFCAKCSSEQNAAWRSANSEKLRASKAAYYAANRAEIAAKHAAWVAANADAVKTQQAEYRVTHRQVAKEASVAWRLANVEKSRATAKAWRSANAEKAAAINEAFHAANPSAKRAYETNRNAKKRGNGGTLSRNLVEVLFAKQRGMCPCCGKRLGKNFHLDHKMPLALGGTNTDDNMQLLRKSCNLEKHAKHPVDFMRQRGFLL